MLKYHLPKLIKLAIFWLFLLSFFLLFSFLIKYEIRPTRKETVIKVPIRDVNICLPEEEETI